MMQHLDEGRIQAWLDRDRSGLGQAEQREIEGHLATCPACAALASNLEHIGAQTSLLLSSDPAREDDLPPFETVVDRSLAAADPGPTRGRPRAALAWAASIAVALGTGWALNDALGPRLDEAAPGQPAAALSPTASPGPSARVAQDEPSAARRRVEAESSRVTLAEVAGVDAAEEEAAEAVLMGAGVRSPAGTGNAMDTPRIAQSPALMADADASLDTSGGGDARPDETGAAAAQPMPAEPSVNIDADVPASTVVRGRVTNQAGTPLAGARVYIPGTSIGALSGPDGRFAIALGESTAAFASEPLSLMVERIGYTSVTQAVGVDEATSSPVEISLAEQALSLDQIVIIANRTAVAERQTGLARELVEDAPASSVGPPGPGLPGLWRESARSDAEGAVGFALATLPDRPVDGIWVSSVGDPAAVSIQQRLDDGTRITLVETLGTMDDAILPEVGSRVSTTRDGVTILLLGDLSEETLQTLLQQVR